MINIFDSEIFLDLDSVFFITLGFEVSIFALVIFVWESFFYPILGLKKYINIQRIHNNEIPRLGGLILFLSLIFFCFNAKETAPIYFFKNFLLAIIPTAIVALKEDLFHNVKISYRFFAILASASFFIYIYQDNLPKLQDILFLNKFTQMPGFLEFFYIFAILSIVNSMNMIDGVNGLCGFVALSILANLFYFSYLTSDIIFMNIILYLFGFTVIFLIFNYPFGRIFLGDFGSYSFGLLLSMVTIVFFGRHSELNSLLALLLLIYPITEMLFTFSRRALTGASVFHPDTKHLHTLIFYVLKVKSYSTRVTNSLVAILLMPLILMPLILIPMSLSKSLHILISIILFIITYGCIYLTSLKIKK
jgi:UDP-N-acetylmuramyl pentapeptide phosphotransferase/UDP-N-acetylglucosamine-1-phosphate transferase